MITNCDWGPHCFSSLSPALPLAKVLLINALNDKLAEGGDQRTALWAHLVWIEENVQSFNYHLDFDDDNISD